MEEESNAKRAASLPRRRAHVALSLLTFLGLGCGDDGAGTGGGDDGTNGDMSSVEQPGVQPPAFSTTFVGACIRKGIGQCEEWFSDGPEARVKEAAVRKCENGTGIKSDERCPTEAALGACTSARLRIGQDDFTIRTIFPEDFALKDLEWICKKDAGDKLELF